MHRNAYPPQGLLTPNVTVSCLCHFRECGCHVLTLQATPSVAVLATWPGLAVPTVWGATPIVTITALVSPTNIPPPTPTFTPVPLTPVGGP